MRGRAGHARTVDLTRSFTVSFDAYTTVPEALRLGWFRARDSPADCNGLASGVVLTRVGTILMFRETGARAQMCATACAFVPCSKCPTVVES